MTFVPFSMLRKKLSSEISMKAEKIDRELYKKPILTDPVLASSTVGKHKELPLTNLSEIYEDSTNRNSVFKTRFFVIKVTPEDKEDFIEGYVPSGQSRSKPVYKVN